MSSNSKSASAGGSGDPLAMAMAAIVSLGRQELEMVLGAVQARLAATPNQMGKGSRTGGKKAAPKTGAAKTGKKPPGPQAAWQVWRESKKDLPLRDLFDPAFPDIVGKDGKTVRPFDLYKAAREAQGQTCGTILEEVVRLTAKAARVVTTPQEAETASVDGVAAEGGN